MNLYEVEFKIPENKTWAGMVVLPEGVAFVSIRLSVAANNPERAAEIARANRPEGLHADAEVASVIYMGPVFVEGQ